MSFTASEGVCRVNRPVHYYLGISPEFPPKKRPCDEEADKNIVTLCI